MLAETDVTDVNSLCVVADWLVDRRHCNLKWQSAVKVIREKINAAIQDMPENEEIKALLSGSCRSPTTQYTHPSFHFSERWIYYGPSRLFSTISTLLRDSPFQPDIGFGLLYNHQCRLKPHFTTLLMFGFFLVIIILFLRWCYNPANDCNKVETNIGVF